LVLAQAAAVRAIPGRKSDVKDAQWWAALLAHALVRASFVPPAPPQALRELTRTRKQLVREAAAHAQRIHKLLKAANRKLASVLSAVVGASGRAILARLVPARPTPSGWPPGSIHAPGASGAPWSRRCRGASSRISGFCSGSTSR
jgi:transposase